MNNDFLDKLRDMRFGIITKSKEILSKTEEDILNEIESIENAIIETEKNERILLEIISVLQKYRDAQYVGSTRGETIYSTTDKCIDLLIREVNKPVCNICKYNPNKNDKPCVYCKHYEYDNAKDFFECEFKESEKMN